MSEKNKEIKEFIRLQVKEFFEFSEKLIEDKQDEMEKTKILSNLVANLVCNCVQNFSNMEFPAAYPTNLLEMIGYITVVGVRTQMAMEDKKEEKITGEKH